MPGIPMSIIGPWLMLAMPVIGSTALIVPVTFIGASACSTPARTIVIPSGRSNVRVASLPVWSVIRLTVSAIAKSIVIPGIPVSTIGPCAIVAVRASRLMLSIVPDTTICAAAVASGMSSMIESSIDPDMSMSDPASFAGRTATITNMPSSSLDRSNDTCAPSGTVAGSNPTTGMSICIAGQPSSGMGSWLMLSFPSAVIASTTPLPVAATPSSGPISIRYNKPSAPRAARNATC